MSDAKYQICLIVNGQMIELGTTNLVPDLATQRRKAKALQAAVNELFDYAQIEIIWEKL